MGPEMGCPDPTVSWLTMLVTQLGLEMRLLTTLVRMARGLALKLLMMMMIARHRTS